MILEHFQEFLGKNDVKYINIKHSPSYSDRDIIRSVPGLARMMVVEAGYGADNNSLQIVLAPPDQSINLNLVKDRLRAKQVRWSSRDRLEEMLAEYDLDGAAVSSNMISTYVAESLTVQSDIVLYEHVSDNFVKVSYSDFEKLFHPKIADFLEPKKYKARLAFTTPASERKNLHLHEQCILGFSMENPNFEPLKLKGMVEWISRRFHRCRVMIGDSIHRNTLQINHEISEAEALRQSTRMAAQVMEEADKVFAANGGACQFEWVLCSKIQHRESYHRHFEQLTRLMNNDHAFTQSVLGFSKLFANRRKKNAQEFLRLSTAYLLEELAIIACLIDDGFPCFVYPGGIGIFEEFAEGKHLAVPDSLHNIIMVGLHF